MTDFLAQALARFADAPSGAADRALARLRDELRTSGLAPDRVIASACACLQQDAALRARFVAQVAGLLLARQHRHLLAETGVLAPTGFLATLRNRLAQRLLPHAPQADLLRDLLAELFARDRDIAWVAAVPVAHWAALFERVAAEPGFAAAARHAGRELDAALSLLAARAAGLAADPERLRYQRRVDAAGVPAALPAGDAARDEAPGLAGGLALPGAVHAWLQSRAAAVAGGTEADGATAAAGPRQLLRSIAAADLEARQLRAAAPTLGTTLGLTHALNAAGQSAGRLRELVLLRTEADPAQRSLRAATLFTSLVAAQGRALHVRDVFTQAGDEVAQQITEHASRVGEHYVTDTRAQWWDMLRRAAGAGVLVGFMALLKAFIVKAHLPPLWETLAVCLNYGGGFVLIHLLHFTVATKQPAMTATLLAARLGQEDASPAGAERLADLAVRTVRTQLAAIAGNVGLAVPTAALVFGAWHLATGGAPISADKAHHLLGELRPLASLALPHAAIAGVCLFLAGVITGYYDNLCIYGRIGERLARHPALRRTLGPVRAQRLGTYIEGNLGALLGNLAFGFLLGGVGFVGFLTGLPLDIRHVAFASANSAYALLTLQGSVGPADVALAVLGVALVATVNVLVAYGLAFWTAFRARRVRYGRARLVLQLVGRRLLRRPRDFFLPPASPPGGQA